MSLIVSFQLKKHSARQEHSYSKANVIYAWLL